MFNILKILTTINNNCKLTVIDEDTIMSSYNYKLIRAIQSIVLLIFFVVHSSNLRRNINNAKTIIE
jgi:hypothetical protein